MSKRTITVTLTGPGADQWADYLIDEVLYHLDNGPDDIHQFGKADYHVDVDRHEGGEAPAGQMGPTECPTCGALYGEMDHAPEPCERLPWEEEH